jgi:Tfp pilus assembly protein PilV
MSQRERGGHSLVELLVAITILSFGLLGLVASVGLIARLLGQARLTERVAAFARGRVEQLRVDACTRAAAAGAEELRLGATGSVVASNRWTVSRDGAYAHIIVTTSQTTRPAALRRLQLVSDVIC